MGVLAGGRTQYGEGCDTPKRRGRNDSGERAVAPLSFGEWFDQQRKLSYLLGLKPGEFLHHTPGELEALVLVYQEREDVQMYRTAWLAAQITPRVWANKGTTPFELLGWESPQPRELTVQEHNERERNVWREMWLAMGAKTETAH